MRSRKVHDSLNSENRNRAHPWRTKNWLGAGCSKFLHVNSRNVHVPPVRPHVAEKTHVSTNGPANVSSRKRTCHRNAFQCNNAVKTTLHHVKNSARPPQQRWTAAVRQVSFSPVLTASLLKAFTSLDEAGALALPEVDISLLSNVVKQYEQGQSIYNDHCLRSENQGVRRQIYGQFTTQKVSLCRWTNVRQVLVHCKI